MKRLAVWRALFLLANALAILALWSEGGLEIFLNPRFAAPVPWVALLLLAMGLVDLGGLPRTSSEERVCWRHVVWFLPLVVGLMVRPESLSGTFAGSRGPIAAGRMIALAGARLPPVDTDAMDDPSETDSVFNLVLDSALADTVVDAPVAVAKSPSRKRIASSSVSTDTVPMVQDAKPQGKTSLWCDLPPADGAFCVDTLRERSWYGQMMALYMDPSRHRGRRLRLVGMAMRDATVEPDGWHVGRMMVWCCAADASPLGLNPVGTIHGDPLVEGEWVAVEGILGTRRARLPGLSEERVIPVLRYVTATRVAAPPQENVFPFEY